MKGIKIICQKKTFLPYLNWFFGFAFLFSTLLTCCIAPSASAFSIGDGGHGTFIAGGQYSSKIGIYFNPTDGWRQYNFVAGDNGSIRATVTGDSQVPSSGQFDSITLWSQSSFKRRSLVSFSVRYVVPANYNYLQFNGVAAITGSQDSNGNWGSWQGSVLSQNCKTNNMLQDTLNGTTVFGESDFTCQYLILLSDDVPLQNYIQFTGQFAYITASTGITVIVSPYSWVQLDDESGGGGSADLTDVEDLLQDILDQLEDNNYATSLSNITSVLNQIKNNNPSASDIATAITEAEEAEMLDAQDDAQDSVDDSQDDVDSASATLIQQVSTLVTGLRQVQPSNCVIAFDLFSTSAYGRGSSAQAYNIDLCSLSRPASFQVIDQILKVVWVVGAILMVLNAMLGLFREVQGGGE